MIGNTEDSEDTLIEKLIKPDFENKFGVLGWEKRLRSERTLKQYELEKLYPEKFITLNAHRWKKLWKVENSERITKCKWTLKKELLKSLNSQWLDLEMSENFAGEQFGNNYRILSKKELNRNPIIKMLRSEQIDGLIADEKILEKNLMLKIKIDIVDENSPELKLELFKKIIMNQLLFDNLKYSSYKKLWNHENILKDKSEKFALKKIIINRIIIGNKFIVLPDPWLTNKKIILNRDRINKVLLACWLAEHYYSITTTRKLS